MIRTLITPTKQNMVVQIPKNYIGKKVEVIIFTSSEVDEDQEFEKKWEKGGLTVNQAKTRTRKYIKSLPWKK